MFSFPSLRSGLDIERPLQKFLHLGRWQVECFATRRHIAVKTVMRELALHERGSMINAYRIFTRRILNIFLLQILKPQFTRLVREPTVKGESLVAREINGITFGAKPQIKVYNSQRLDL